MNTGGDAAEQIIRITLDGVEVAARITGAAVKNIAILLYTILSQKNKTKGKARLTSMLRSGRELKVFTVKNEDMKTFIQEAKKYGVLYCVLTDRKNKDPKAEIDVVARAEDAPRINRIVEKFHLASVDTAKIVTEAVIDKDTKANQTVPEKEEKEKLMDDLLGKSIQKEENAVNPSVAKTEKPLLSEPSSKKQGKAAEGVSKSLDKPSVKEQLREIRESRKEKEAGKPPAPDKSSDKASKTVRKTIHKQPAKKKSKKQRNAR